MANFNAAVLTAKGIALLAKAQAGQTSIEFTKAASGDGSYDTDESLLAAEALKAQRQEFPINKVSVANDATVIVKFLITNEQNAGNLSEGYYVKEVGIFAADPDEGEILYAIATAVENQWDYMPAYNGLLPAAITVEFLAEVSNAAEVTIRAAGAYLLVEDAEEEFKKIWISINGSQVPAGLRSGYVRTGQKDETTVGGCATAEGSDTTASGENSHAEGNCSVASGKNAHAEGGAYTIRENTSDQQYSLASGCASHAEGDCCTAASTGSHAEGSLTQAMGVGSHAEGFRSKVESSSSYGHAEGYWTTVKGSGGHAEGWMSKAEGAYSHAEGEGCHAQGESSHAEGDAAYATGDYSHAEGKWNHCNNYAAHVGGKYANTSTDKVTTADAQLGNVLTIGNGTGIVAGNVMNSSNAFRVTYAGAVYGKGNFNTAGADYAEFIKPWADNNTDAEDRRGYFVTIKDGLLYKANEEDYITGIISGNPSIVGNADEDYYWMYERDEFDSIVMEDVLERVKKRDKNGEIVYDEKTHEPVMVETGKVLKNARMKLSVDYDPSKQKNYVERKDRPEWDYVGMLGVLPVRDDGTCIPGRFCKCGKGGIATLAEQRDFDTYMVIERVNDHVVKVILK